MLETTRGLCDNARNVPHLYVEGWSLYSFPGIRSERVVAAFLQKMDALSIVGFKKAEVNVQLPPNRAYCLESECDWSAFIGDCMPYDAFCSLSLLVSLARSNEGFEGSRIAIDL